MPVATVTSKGQVTLPKKVRDRLGLQAGDRLELDVNAAGELVGRKRRELQLEDLFGMIPYDGPPLTQEDIDDAVQAEAVARYERSRGR